MTTPSTVMPPAALEFCAHFSLSMPIANAPMATVAGGALAAAVSDAGGLGVIGGGYGDYGWIRSQRALAGDRDVAVGLITWRLAEQPHLVARLVDEGVRTFVLSFGEPSPYARTILAAGGTLICQVQSVDEAERAAACGATAIIAQGNEAGGHGRSGEPVASLVPEVVAALGPVPVLAAGGIANGGDLAAMWARGAAGVTVGTRLYATPEAIDSDAAKQHLIQAADGDTIRTSVFEIVRGPGWPAGYDGRALQNVTTDEWHDRIDVLRAHAEAPRETYASAAQHDDVTRRVIWAGTGVGQVHEIRPAAEVLDKLITDACAAHSEASGNSPASGPTTATGEPIWSDTPRDAGRLRS
jgi:nitronate monooxygenase